MHGPSETRSKLYRRLDDADVVAPLPQDLDVPLPLMQGDVKEGPYSFATDNEFRFLRGRLDRPVTGPQSCRGCNPEAELAGACHGHKSKAARKPAALRPEVRTPGDSTSGEPR